MHFTLTLNGEGPELSTALRLLKGVMEGQSVVSGEVSATVAPVQVAPTQQPIAEQYQQQQPVYQEQIQPVYQQQQPIQQQQSFPQLQPQPQQFQQQPIQQQPQQNPGYNAGSVPLSVTTYTMDQLSVAATQLMDAGRQPELVGLIAQFGVPALTMLPKEHYGEFATRLRAMGAKI